MDIQSHGEFPELANADIDQTLMRRGESNQTMPQCHLVGLKIQHGIIQCDSDQDRIGSAANVKFADHDNGA